MHGVLQDVYYAFRMLAKSPGATVIALVTLALGIGANTATFSFINAMANMPNRFADAEKLAFVYSSTDEDEEGFISGLDYLDWCEQAESFAGIALYARPSRFLSGAGEPERVNGVVATANLLPMLGLDAQLGRLYSAEEDSPAAERVVLLTERLWQRKFDRSPDVLHRTIVLNDKPHTVIGVLPPEFDMEDMWYRCDFVAPLRLDPVRLKREDRWYRSIARLDPDNTHKQAQTEMTGIAARLADAYPETNAKVGVTVRSVTDRVFSANDRLESVALLAAVGMVLLIACVNLANLLLAKASARGREFAVRAALGASRARIIRQLLTESLLLALLGGALGLLFGTWTIDLFSVLMEGHPFQEHELGLNPAVLTYTLIASCVAALLFGLAPALTTSRVSVSEALKEGAAAASAGRARNKLRNGLVVAQLAIALPLFICCGLTIRHLIALRSAEFGFNAERLITMQVDLPWYRYREPTQWVTFYRDAIEAIEAMPGIDRAGASVSLPIFVLGATRMASVTIEGRSSDETSPLDVGGYKMVTPGFFETMEIPLLSGRYFTASDHADGQPVALINERMARQYWPNEDPVGQRLTLDQRASGITNVTIIGADPPEAEVTWRMVVGVVANAGSTLRGGPPPPTLYLPHAQKPSASMAVVARTLGDPKAAIPALRSAIRTIDPGAPVHDFLTVADIVHRWSRDDRGAAWFLGTLAALALGLASLGLYGVMSYAVEQRTHEIGVRVALGAGGRAILRLVIKRCVTLAAIGIAIGLVLSAPVGLAIESLLFGVSGIDPVAYAGVSALLLAVAVLAGYLPARRATRIDPMVALRCE
ncbi:MAG: ABC transporter permease [Phycisphaerales bacterium]|nr:MAG: ABC transporter permease [Phycisphaerales bacterium]